MSFVDSANEIIFRFRLVLLPISFCKILKNKLHRVNVLPKGFFI